MTEQTEIITIPQGLDIEALREWARQLAQVRMGLVRLTISKEITGYLEVDGFDSDGQYFSQIIPIVDWES